MIFRVYYYSNFLESEFFMGRNRMEAFSDGVLAIIITIMVLKLKTPESVEISYLKEIYPTFVAYVLSYVYVGIYWANHHHLVGMLDKVTGRVLWRNLFWLFWMSLIPTATEWLGLFPTGKMPMMVYGVLLLMCVISYRLLQKEIIIINGKDSALAKSIGKDIKGKLSVLLYAISIFSAFYFPIVSYVIYFFVALMWFVPDKRLEKIWG